MNKLEFSGSWDQVKGRLKQAYGTLTDNDLTYAEGRDEELLGKLKSKLGKSEEEVREIIRNC
ncbi:MAG TPA: CsbD family protein [Verrucomicrobiales bacterium]|nr:CsbD family protein [Verrucomicrobiales bacterium]